MTKVITFSGPSGSGKNTLIEYLIAQGLNLHFSVSATSRAPRGTDRDGVEYFFLTPEEFRSRIAAGEFLEYEEVYTDRFYGTLLAPVERQIAAGQNVISDIDVKGALNFKRHYADRCLTVFIQPPSIAALRERLEKRGTETAEAIQMRLDKAEYEMSFAPQFDALIVNDDLTKAQEDIFQAVSNFIKA